MCTPRVSPLSIPIGLRRNDRISLDESWGLCPLRLSTYAHAVCLIQAYLRGPCRRLWSAAGACIMRAASWLSVEGDAATPRTARERLPLLKFSGRPAPPRHHDVACWHGLTQMSQLSII